MKHLINDPQFGEIIDFDHLMVELQGSYDKLFPDFDMVGSVVVGSKAYDDEPNYMTAGGASILAYSMLLAAEEYELAKEFKGKLFTLGWTEEQTGSDLLSVTTQATPDTDDPTGRKFYVKGQKWLINNSFHAEYHSVVAKLDPSQDGPRALSIFIVPRSSTKNWERLETHVLSNMVLTKFEIDGPGILVGKVGQGLQILQRMSMPAKYICSYLGARLLIQAINASLDHLSTKKIFKEHPINFTNVFRQMYNISLQSAFLNFAYYRATALSDSSFLQFHGTMLKSWLLLRCNEIMCDNLLVAGSKGFLRTSVIGRNAIDSFVLPVFDGHYTLNTLMTEKMMERYLNATQKGNLEERVALLRERIYTTRAGNQMNIKSTVFRNPEFYDYADYMQQIGLPFDLDAAGLVSATKTLVKEIADKDFDVSAEYKYKVGTLVHWMESIQAAAEFWKVTGEDIYLNVVIQQYNSYVKIFNDIIIEGALDTDMLTSMKQLPLPEVEDHVGFLRHMLNHESRWLQREKNPEAAIAD